MISIRDKDPIKLFQGLLNKLKSKTNAVPLDEITKEVELVRAKRHGKKG